MVSDGRLHLYWGAVARNMDRARRRMLRPELVKGDVDMGPVTLDGGAILRAPSDDADTPALPHGTLALHPPPGHSELSSVSDDDPSAHVRAVSPRRMTIRSNDNAPILKIGQDEEDEEFP